MSTKIVSLPTVQKYCHSMTLMPRLEYCLNLLEEIISELQKNHHSIRKENKHISCTTPTTEELLNLELERKLSFSLESLLKIQQKLFSISVITTAPIVIAPLVPAIRTISAQLYSILPLSSQKLSELSIYLGSIGLDSATLIDGSFDFSKSNLESKSLLDEVKLIVDSKISKLYPNLDF